MNISLRLSARASQPQGEAGDRASDCHFPKWEKDNRQWASSEVQRAQPQADWLDLMADGSTNGNISPVGKYSLLSLYVAALWW